MFNATSPAWGTVKKLSLMTFFLNLYFLSPVIVFFYQQKGLDFFQILALESFLSLCIFLFEVPTGILADKIGRRKTIILGSAFFMLQSIIFLLSNSFLFFILAFALSGIGVTLHSGTTEAIIYDQLKRENQEKEMKKAMGMVDSASSFAMVIAPVIGSILASDLNPERFTLVLVMTVLATSTGFICSLFISDDNHTPVKETNPLTILAEGSRIIKNNPALMRILLLSIFSSPFIMILNYLYQPFFKNANVAVSLFGLIFGCSLLLSGVASRHAHAIEKKWGSKLTVFVTTLIPGLAYVSMAIIQDPILAVLSFIIVVAVSGVRTPLFSAYKNHHIPSHIRATVLSVISLIGSLFSMIMRLIIGKIADWNLYCAFFLMGAIIITASLLLQINESHLEANKS